LKKRFNTVGIGGTFDELHKGHRALILKAFDVGNRVQIGLCTDEFAQKLVKNHEIASYKHRMKELFCLLEKTGLLQRADIVPISNAYGTATTSKELEAIVVSKETEPVAHQINVVRKRSGLTPLKVIAIDMVPAENCVTISTTRIRHKEIDREGRLLRK